MGSKADQLRDNRLAERAQRTRKLLAYLKGKAGEHDMLRGVVLAGYSGISDPKYRHQWDDTLIAERMDDIIQRQSDIYAEFVAAQKRTLAGL